MGREYIKTIRSLMKRLPREITDAEEERKAAMPTQASSEFLINKEQGDWAEHIVTRAINNAQTQYAAVKYGKSDDIVAGESGYKEFYEDYIQELHTIGKRPDLLILDKGLIGDIEDISDLKDHAAQQFVPKAVCGLEVRSSSFKVRAYNDFFAKLKGRHERAIKEGYEALREMACANGKHLNERWLEWAKADFDTDLEGLPPVPVLSAKIKKHRFAEQMEHVKNQISAARNQLRKRDFLSFTPKVGDIHLIYKWIQAYGVPHYYVQVFFDSVYAISFQSILQILADRRHIRYFIERNQKNQMKQTIHISIDEGVKLADIVEPPEGVSKFKELERGRMLYYVGFEGGTANLSVPAFRQLLP